MTRHPTSRRDPNFRRPPPPTASSPRDPRRWLALALLALADFVVILDATIVTIALPSIGQNLHASTGELSWIVSAYLKVHGEGPSEADVTEGSGRIWERLHYDWSDPNRVVMTTTDSNTWGGDSSHTYTFTRKTDGTTEVDAVVVREGKNFKGRALGIVLGIVGKRVLGGELEKTAKAIEARNDGASSAEPT